MKKVYLCNPPKGYCPSVDILENHVRIGEDENTCTLTIKQWNILKNKIKNNEI